MPQLLILHLTDCLIYYVPFIHGFNANLTKRNIDLIFSYCLGKK